MVNEETTAIAVQQAVPAVPTPESTLADQKHTAQVLMSVATETGMMMKLGGNDYLTATGYQTLATLVGIRTVILSVEKIHEDKSVVAYEAVAECYDRHGDVVSRATAQSGTDENTSKSQGGWGKRNAAMAMAQTRAQRRAQAQATQHIVSLAGLPTEEDFIDVQVQPQPQPQPQVNEEALKAVGAAADKVGMNKQQVADLSRLRYPDVRINDLDPNQCAALAKEILKPLEDRVKLLQQAFEHANGMESLEEDKLPEFFSSIQATDADVADALGVESDGSPENSVAAWIGGEGHAPEEMEIECERDVIGAVRAISSFMFVRESTRLAGPES